MAKKHETPEHYARRNTENRDYEAAAKSGSAVAQNVIAARLAQGYFVEQDDAGALYWYCQAVKQGYSDSKWNAGTMIELGEGGAEKNLELAMQLMQEAADAGVASACHYFINLYECGLKGASVDAERCAELRAQLDRHDYDVFSEPWDLERDHGIVVEMPTIVHKTLDD